MAVKGLGGFLLIADARREEVVMKLRARKASRRKTFRPHVSFSVHGVKSTAKCRRPKLAC